MKDDIATNKILSYAVDKGYLEMSVDNDGNDIYKVTKLGLGLMVVLLTIRNPSINVSEALAL